MKEIPASYITLQKKETFLKIRPWIRKGLLDSAMSEQLTKRYTKTQSPTERLFIGRLLTLVYFRQPQIARTVGNLFEIPKFSALTPAESVFVINDMRFNKNYTELLEWEETFPPESSDGIFPEGSCTYVYHLTDNIYYFKSSEGVELLRIENCKDDILVDEQRFVEEPPLYFTEHNHFVSPVYKLNVMTQILDYLFNQLGYPPIKILRTAIFTKAILLNYEDYVEKKGDGWEGVRIVELKRAKEPVFKFIEHPETRTDISALTRMKDTLSQTMIYAKLIYRNLANGRFTVELTDEVLKEYVKKLQIFQRGKG